MQIALVLHARLDQIDRIHHESSEGASNAAKAKVVGRLGKLPEEFLCFRLGHVDRLRRGRRAIARLLEGPPPRRIEDLGKVGQAQAARRLVQARKVEEDVGLHGSEERETRGLGRLVQELGARDLAVGALGASASHNDFYEVHLRDHVLKGSYVGVRDFAAHVYVAQRVQVLEQVV